MTTKKNTARAQTAIFNPVVPAVSKEATARKLDIENFAADAELEPVEHTIETRRQELEQTIRQLEEKRDEYVERLDLGASKIETARAQGKDVTLWEDYWIQLLHQYEAVCDKLRDLYVQV